MAFGKQCHHEVTQCHVMFEQLDKSHTALEQPQSHPIFFCQLGVQFFLMVAVSNLGRPFDCPFAAASLCFRATCSLGFVQGSFAAFILSSNLAFQLLLGLFSYFITAISHFANEIGADEILLPDWNFCQNEQRCLDSSDACSP